MAQVKGAEIHMLCKPFQGKVPGNVGVYVIDQLRDDGKASGVRGTDFLPVIENVLDMGKNFQDQGFLHDIPPVSDG